MATTYNNLYMDIRQTLRQAGIEAATLEARELMCFASGKATSQLVQDGQLYVPPAIEERARDLVCRHLAGEPVAYLIGEWEFYGLPLDISESVPLIPRPDTETLVDHVVAWLRPLPECRVLDLCAGSRLHRSGHRQSGPRRTGGAGGAGRGGLADLPPEYPPQQSQRTGGVLKDGRSVRSASPAGGF